MKTTYERFWSKVAVTPSCWLWTAYKIYNGYGQFWIEGKTQLAHRVSYEMEIGPIPEGFQLDHLCRVRECVNPSHLEPVTQAENIRRGEAGKYQLGKTHCPQGHEYNLENTRNYQNKRHCRACSNEGNKRYWKNKKLKNALKLNGMSESK